MTLLQRCKSTAESLWYDLDYEDGKNSSYKGKVGGKGGMSGRESTNLRRARK